MFTCSFRRIACEAMAPHAHVVVVVVVVVLAEVFSILTDADPGPSLSFSLSRRQMHTEVSWVLYKSTHWDRADGALENRNRDGISHHQERGKSRCML